MKRVGYVTVGSSTNIREWSGLNSHILGALRGAGLDVTVADNLGPPRALWLRLKARICRKYFGRTYALERDRTIARRWSDQAARLLMAQGDLQTVVSTGTIPIAQLPTQFRTAIWADATFHSLRSTYPGFERFSRNSIRSGDWLEQRAFDRSGLICFSSEWAAADAATFYGVPDHKLAVIPFGANCPPAFPDETAAMAAVEERSQLECHLVFIGVEWERKGGPLVLETARRLHQQGVPVRVTLVGCLPPPAEMLPPFVESVGFLNKHVHADWIRWNAILRKAHFLFVPSLAECYGLVYAEASAYAVPSLARRVGGVPSVIRHGQNGLLFSADDCPDAYAAAVAQLWREPDAYRHLAMASFREWDSRLNWRVAGKCFAEQLSARGGLMPQASAATKNVTQ